MSAAGTSDYGTPPVSATGTSDYGTTPVSAAGTSDYGTPPVSAVGTTGYGTPPVSAVGTSGMPDAGTDDAILPATLGDDALRDAVGPPSKRARRRRPTEPEHDDGDPMPKKRSWRTGAIAAASIVVGLSAAVLVFLGRANAQRFMIACDASHVTAEQGRGFPPWGSHPLTGPEWKPITLPTNAECKPRETDDEDELGKWYLDLLIERASTTLTARNLLDGVGPHVEGAPAAANPLDLAAAQLNQALLLARAPERRDQRKEIERLLGDVDYWRAASRLRDASAVLLDAAKQFDTAAAQRPRHVSDAAAWATFLRKLADDLRAGPNATPTPTFPSLPALQTPTGTATAPPGVALPVEPGGAGGAAASPPTPDAGVPSGGVLL